MALKITEVFGYHPADGSAAASAQRESLQCPFTEKVCRKRFRSGGTIHGTCTVLPPNEPETVCCPNRLYAEGYKILREAARDAFGHEIQLIRPTDVRLTQGTTHRVVAFGTGWGGELSVPRGSGEKGGGFSADWVLALLSGTAEVIEFIPVEVQSIDTTGSYQAEWCRIMGRAVPGGLGRESNMNWENVNKRIIPQLLTKGNVFRGETLCKKGLFFICPATVYHKMLGRLGAPLRAYGYQPGALTFITYKLSDEREDGHIRPLVLVERFTTTVDNLRDVFNSTLELPPLDVMGEKIRMLIRKSLQVPAKRKGR